MCIVIVYNSCAFYTRRFFYMYIFAYFNMHIQILFIAHIRFTSHKINKKYFSRIK